MSLWPVAESGLERAFRDARRQVLLRAANAQGVPAPESWTEWLAAMFPDYVRHAFADRHREFWDWLWDVTLESTPDPFVGIWPRGGGKSTSVELGVTALGLRGRRRYAWYVRETQEQADNSVSNIAALLESKTVERHYPGHADRMLSKFGTSKGWRRNRLRTAAGFTVDALGLDSAARGAKVDEQRPDLIVLDDIDDKHDSPQTTARKIATLTSSVLPAGSENVAVIAIQNLIIADGFFSRMADGRADYLSRRIVSGPYPAIVGLETTDAWDEETQTRRHVITAGTPTWEGQDIRVCQHLIDTMGLAAFRKECQHEVQEKAEGLVLKNFSAELVEDLTDDECRDLVRMGQVFGGIDFGAWRFGFVLRAVDRAGKVHRIGAYFSQRDELEHRARVVHAIASYYGCPSNLRIWGDAANPTDIMELNAAFRRIGSPYHVVAVAMENKLRMASVERINDLHARGALLYRRSMPSHMHRVVEAQWKALGYPGTAPDLRTWRLGYNSSSAGTEMSEDRLLWEIEHWTYPVPKEGEAQKQDPDDHTADGADMIAADRYAIMSWWRAAKPEEHRPRDLKEARELTYEQQKYDHKGDEQLERLAAQQERERKRLRQLVRRMRST